jgi:hypothetical protein
MVMYVTDRYGIRRCEECGYEPEDGHNPEVHAAELRAAEYAYWEPPEYDSDLREYDGPPDDSQCVRCGAWDDRPEEVLLDGEYQPVCADCVTPAEREAQAIDYAMSDHEVGLHGRYADTLCLYCQ